MLRILDLDKSWDGLNFTFRTLWHEAPSFFEHAAEIANLEIGLGPALYPSSRDMAAFAQNFEKVSEPELLAAFDKTDLSTAHLDKFWARRDSEVTSYLVQNFLALKAFAAYTTEHSLGAILQFGRGRPMDPQKYSVPLRSVPFLFQAPDSNLAS